MGAVAGADFALYHHEKHMLGQAYQAWVAFGTTSPDHIAGPDGVPVILVYRNRARWRRDQRFFAAAFLAGAFAAFLAGAFAAFLAGAFAAFFTEAGAAALSRSPPSPPARSPSWSRPPASSPAPSSRLRTATAWAVLAAGCSVAGSAGLRGFSRGAAFLAGASLLVEVLVLVVEVFFLLVVEVFFFLLVEVFSLLVERLALVLVLEVFVLVLARRRGLRSLPPPPPEQARGVATAGRRCAGSGGRLSGQRRARRAVRRATPLSRA